VIDEVTWQNTDQQSYVNLPAIDLYEKLYHISPMSDAHPWPNFLPAFRTAAQQTGFMETILAETPDGPVSVWTRGDNKTRKVYISAGIHGDEPAGPLALLEMMSSDFFTEDTDWAICPALNPTGLAKQQRENANGCDLNRDYWHHSSAETKAHIDWLKSSSSPDLFLSLHEDWESEGFYFYEINLGEDQPERAKAILESVQPIFLPEAGKLIDGHIPRSPGWIYHEAEPDLPDGWPEAIYLAKQGCPLSFTFETPSSKKLTDRIKAHIAAAQSICSSRLD